MILNRYTKKFINVSVLAGNREFKGMKFRYDINALRAFAVLSVVFFHFDESILTGGFIGVDIFFVISGYLMTSIIKRKIETNNFSLLDFYLARVNRIFPALLVLLLVLMVISLLFLNPLDLRSLAWKVASSALFVSNVAFTFLGGGYFAESAQTNWLLHTWSLSAEWQFYLIYPLLLLIVARIFGVRFIGYILLLVFSLSFLASVLLSDDYATSSYFNLHTRAWQMVAGGLIIYLPPNRSKSTNRAFFLMGLALIFSSLFLFDSETIWPGMLAFVPVFGASLIIYSNIQDMSFINNKIVQLLGTWSYSIYLWHWPIVVAIYIYALPYWSRPLGIFLSVILGFASYHYIESLKFRRHLTQIRGLFLSKPIWGAVTLSAFSALIYINDGFEWRLNSEQYALFKEVKNAKKDWYYPKPNLTIADAQIRYIGGNNLHNILFLGASHIEQTYSYTENAVPDFNTYYLTKNGCLPVDSYHAPNWSCNNVHSFKKLILDIKFEKVVISAYLFSAGLTDDNTDAISHRVQKIQNLIQLLSDTIPQVFIILPEPYHESFDPLMHHRRKLPDTVAVHLTRDKHRLVYDILSKIEFPENVTKIDPYISMCQKFCKVKENGQYVYRDSGHFRPWYAIETMTYLEPIIHTD